MIKGKDIICISYTTWEGEFTKSTVQILSLLAKNNNVIFVEYPRTLKDLIKLFLEDKKNLAYRMLGLKKRLVKIKSTRNTDVNHLVMPPTLPINFIKNKHIYRFFSRINTHMFAETLESICWKQKIYEPIIISAYNPTYGLGTLGKLNEVLNVYYCYDGMDLKRNHWNTIKDEKKYSKKVDAVIASSDYLKEEKQKVNKHCFAVKNGVNFEMFENHSKVKPNNNNDSKKIGYVGCLDYRFDIELMDYVIQSMPDVKFEFTGYLSNPEIAKNLSKYSNVTFFNSIKQQEVPKLLASYDAGIIPYNNLEINKGIYPLKANEYLSLGLPVVMTDFAELSEFDSIVRIAKNKEEFLKNLQTELKFDSSIKIKNRIEFAKNNSWKKRAESFSNILELMWKQKYRNYAITNSQ